MCRSSDCRAGRLRCCHATSRGAELAGQFITFEGGEGTGKSTQARLLAEALARCGVPVLLTREPGGSPGAERLRRVLLSPQTSFAPEAETLLHFAARADHVAHTIRPALAAGLWVVCDRFADSTMAYQGHGQGADRDTIAALTGQLGLPPDLTLVLEVAEPVAVARLSARGEMLDRYERLDPSFHARVRAGFRAIATAEPDRCRLVDTDAPRAEVHGQIMTIVRERFGSSRST